MWFSLLIPYSFMRSHRSPYLHTAHDLLRLYFVHEMQDPGETATNVVFPTHALKFNTEFASCDFLMWFSLLMRKQRRQNLLAAIF